MTPILHLAPLHGVTNCVFRNAFFSHFSGFDAAVAPFIPSVNAASVRETHFKDLLPPANSGIPLIPQILGNDADQFVATAKILKDFGYDEVSWNLGCPYPMVANKKRGSGLLPFPDLIEKFLEGACSRSALPISVKARLGRTERGELLRLMPVFNSFPLRRIVIHPRIATQMYEGEVDLDGFSEAAAESTHEVMYNGDIKDAATFASLQARFPSIGQWMVGRWALSDPFLASALKGAPPPADPVRVVRDFHDELLDGYRGILSGQKHVLDKMKEVWTFLGLSFSGSDRNLKRICKANTLEAYGTAVAAVFEGEDWIA
ncbi:MAG: hypothetical protein A2413_07890 [Treponema sp. RIFOXYC1_FULL_61_9]|nr:MAG: hypothetical protein A2001_14650 [Treponema sp. GWC1_61_84]OHE75908.1 MAG: hypothetical protein A2413_07890 [Treponema sp. RIFOXYC1_FULL_61_9]